VDENYVEKGRRGREEQGRYRGKKKGVMGGCWMESEGRRRRRQGSIHGMGKELLLRICAMTQGARLKKTRNQACHQEGGKKPNRNRHLRGGWGGRKSNSVPKEMGTNLGRKVWEKKFRLDLKGFIDGHLYQILLLQI